MFLRLPDRYGIDSPGNVSAAEQTDKQQLPLYVLPGINYGVDSSPLLITSYFESRYDTSIYTNTRYHGSA